MSTRKPKLETLPTHNQDVNELLNQSIENSKHDNENYHIPLFYSHLKTYSHTGPEHSNNLDLNPWITSPKFEHNAQFTLYNNDKQDTNNSIDLNFDPSKGKQESLKDSEFYKNSNSFQYNSNLYKAKMNCFNKTNNFNTKNMTMHKKSNTGCFRNICKQDDIIQIIDTELNNGDIPRISKDNMLKPQVGHSYSKSLNCRIQDKKLIDLRPSSINNNTRQTRDIKSSGENQNGRVRKEQLYDTVGYNSKTFQAQKTFETEYNVDTEKSVSLFKKSSASLKQNENRDHKFSKRINRLNFKDQEEEKMPRAFSLNNLENST